MTRFPLLLVETLLTSLFFAVQLSAHPEGCLLPQDLDGNGAVGAGDIGILLGAWGPCGAAGGCTADLTQDGTIDAADLAVLLGSWGAAPGVHTDVDYAAEALSSFGGMGAYDVADLDGDGDLDVVTAWRQAGTRMVTFRNEGPCAGAGASGVRWTRIESTVAINSSGDPKMFLFESNGDGQPDAIIHSDGLRFSMGLPGGSFGPATLINSGTLGSPFARVDRNGDGIDELLLESGGSLNLASLEGGVLIGETLATFNGTQIAVTVGDADDDGDEDILWVWSAASGVSIELLRNERGEFVREPLATSPTGIADAQIGDISGDGAADIVLAVIGGFQMRVMLGDGEGGFGPLSTTTYGLGGAFGLGDVDGDGDLDMFGHPTWSTTSALSVTFNDGRGNFAFESTIDFQAPGSPGTPATRPRLLDLDGDCLADGIARGFCVGVYRARNGTLRGPATLSSIGLTRIEVCDIDRDGFDDALVVVGNGLGSVIWGTGGEEPFGPATAPQPPGGGDWSAADCTGDGLYDLLGIGSGNTVTIRRQIGPRTFVVIASTPTVDAPTAVLPMRLDGDIYGDAFVYGPLGFSVHRGAAIGPLGPGRTTAVADVTSAAVGDIDGDGDDDVVLGTVAGAFLVWRNERGELVPLPQRASGAGLPAATVCLFDADLDGDCDLMVQRCQPTPALGMISLYRSEGGQFTLSDEQECTECMTQARAADLNRDGLPEIVGIAPAAGVIARRVVLPSCTFGCFQSYVSSFGNSLGIGDFGIDDGLDILTGSNSGASLFLTSPAP